MREEKGGRMRKNRRGVQHPVKYANETGRGSTAAFNVLAENPNVGFSVLPDNFVKDGAPMAQSILP